MTSTLLAPNYSIQRKVRRVPGNPVELFARADAVVQTHGAAWRGLLDDALEEAERVLGDAALVDQLGTLAQEAGECASALGYSSIAEVMLSMRGLLAQGRRLPALPIVMRLCLEAARVLLREGLTDVEDPRATALLGALRAATAKLGGSPQTPG